MTRIFWDASSIDGMERTASINYPQSCEVKIRDEWLEVYAEPDHNFKNFKYTYKWGKNFVERTDAVAILASR